MLDEQLASAPEVARYLRFATGAPIVEDPARAAFALVSRATAMPPFTWSSTGSDAYPVASFTWLLIPASIEDPGKRQAIKDFLMWMMKDGQQYCEPLAYAQLPEEVVAKEGPVVNQIQ